jgi:shikimate kinase
LKDYRKLPWHGKNIYFLGFMGSGKSRIGGAFAQLLGWPFHDTDDLIETRTGKIINDIFAEEGEDAFRNHETDVIRQVAGWKNNVIALGGGAVLSKVNWELISASGVTICLTAPVAVLSERISRGQNRPLMANLSEIEQRRKISDMLTQRQPLYDRAQFTFVSSNDRPVAEFVSTIFETLMEKL